jgi:hypothetical protein
VSYFPFKEMSEWARGRLDYEEGAGVAEGRLPEDSGLWLGISMPFILFIG